MPACKTCNDTGKVQLFFSAEDCPECNAETEDEYVDGYDPDCPACGGSGMVVGLFGSTMPCNSCAPTWRPPPP